MYLIPRNISKRFEFFPGWGWKELFILLVALGAGAAFACLFGLFTGSPLRFLFIILFVVPGYLATQPVMSDGSSALEILIYMQVYSHRQKLYLYRKEGI